ncbi:MAG: hypothetical protein IJ242_12485 [Clostridia bacterium]|nr:hypothetical protein [Clostridia bacterium]
MTKDIHAPDFCLRCLLREMRGQEAESLFAEIQEWIRAIPESYRADGKTVNMRLNACRTCPQLAEGVCKLCGCYVEYRAAHVLRNCPDLPPRWDADESWPGNTV